MCKQLETKPVVADAKPAEVKKPAPQSRRRRYHQQRLKEDWTPPKPDYQKNPTLLVTAFETGVLPREQWTHAAHLVVALYYAHNHRTEAYAKMREGIQRYNRLTGLVETPTRGFHETITRAWFQLVLHFLDLFDDGRPVESLAQDLVTLFPKDELFRYYTRDALLSSDARKGLVDPDLRPLPVLEEHTPADRRFLAALAKKPAAKTPYIVRLTGNGPTIGDVLNAREIQRHVDYTLATRS